MPSNYLEIEKALIAAVESVDSTTPLGHPNKELKTPPSSLWLQLNNVRSITEPATLGDEGEDNHLGFLQIDINCPKDKGTKDVLEKADEFSSFFTAGKSLLYNQQEVKVLSCSLGAGRYVGGYYRISLTINYYARTTRQ